MATITFTIPDALAAEFNQIAQARGHTNAKVMLRTLLRNILLDARLEPATQQVIQAKVDETDEDMGTVE